MANGGILTPVVALHGWALNAAVFEPFAGHVSGRQLFALDLPGHGRRRDAELGSDPQLIARVLLDSSPERAVWMGWSLGGMLALQCGLLCPQRVAGLVIISASASFIRRPHWTVGMPLEKLKAMAEALQKDSAKVVNDFLTLQVLASPKSRPVLRSLKAALQERGSASQEALESGLELLEEMDFSGRLESLDIPVLVISGDLDRLVRPASASLLAERLPKGQALTIEHAAHVPFLSHRVLFERSVSSWLEQVGIN